MQNLVSAIMKNCSMHPAPVDRIYPPVRFYRSSQRDAGRLMQRVEDWKSNTVPGQVELLGKMVKPAAPFPIALPSYRTSSGQLLLKAHTVDLSGLLRRQR